MRNSLRILLAALVSGALAFTGVTATAKSDTAVPTILQGSDLSNTGNSSLEELKACINQTRQLNAYYLIDHSASWEAESNGNPPTDPKKTRIPILQKSIEQLAELAGDNSAIEVNIASGYFGTQGPSSNAYGSEWVSLTGANLENVQQGIEKSIKSKNLGYTNWSAGLQAARDSFKGKQGCNTVIWLTDGEIDLPGWESDETQATQALEELCSTGGLPQQMRNEGITIVGVYLNRQDPTGRAAWMQPLVEGTGNSKSCGDGSPVTRGVFINAKTISDLAFEFIRLGERISGAGEIEIGSDGRFEIGSGVTSFKIISTAPSSDISLISPGGIFPENSITRETTGGVSELTVKLRDKKDYGSWQLKGAESARNLLLLYIEFKIKPSPLYVNESRTQGKIFVSIDYSNKNLQKGKTYEDTTLVATGNGVDFEESYTGGSQTFEIPVSNPKDLTKLEFSFKQGGTSKSDRSSSFDYSKLPSITGDNDFGIVRGYKEPATGTVTVFGPKSGSGIVCFTGGPLDSKNVVDSARQSRTWTVKIADDSCIEVGESEKLTVGVTAIPSQSADAKEVDLSVPVKVEDSSGKALEGAGKQGLHLLFKTHLDTNVWLRILLLSILLILAILIPLLVMYLINLFTTKVEHGNDLVRAMFPVKIALKGESILTQIDPSGDFDTELYSIPNPQEIFKMRPPQGDARSISDPEIGVFRAVIPPFPLLAPWYEVEANDGYIVLTGQVPSPRQEAGRHKDGRRAPFNGQLSRTWLIIAKKDDLLSNEDGSVPARMVIFDKRGRGGSERARQRLTEVRQEAKLGPRLTKLSKALKDSSNSAKAKTKNQDSGPNVEQNAGFLPPIPGRGPNTPPPPPGRGPNTPPPPPGRGPNTPPPPPGRGPNTPPPPPGRGPNTPPPPPGRGPNTPPPPPGRGPNRPPTSY